MGKLCLYVLRNIGGRTLATQVLLRHCSKEDRVGAADVDVICLLNGFLTIIALTVYCPVYWISVIPAV